MKINVIIKIVLILIMSISIIIPIYAGTGDNFDLEAFEDGSVPNSVSNLTQNTLGTAISIVRVVGVGIAIVILMVVGMRYMLASPGDRADIKKHAVPFVIGAVVLFGTSGILGVIAKLASTIE